MYYSFFNRCVTPWIKNSSVSRLSAVEADGCQVSRPFRGLHDFIPTACVRNMRTWGGAWHVDLDEGKERRPRTAWRGSGRSFYNSSSGPSTCTWRELETGPYNTAVSGWGPHDWSVLSPTAVHRDKRTTSWLACWTLRWGPTWDWERWHVRGGSTPGGRWAAESEQGPRDRSVLSPTGTSAG